MSVELLLDLFSGEAAAPRPKFARSTPPTSTTLAQPFPVATSHDVSTTSYHLARARKGADNKGVPALESPFTMLHLIATTVAVLAVVLPAACAAPTNFELHAYEPVASPNATVKAGAARFTVLSEQLIRAEYSVDGGKTFEDRPTLFAVQRAPVNGVPKFS